MKTLKNIFVFSKYPPLILGIITAAISLLLPFIFAGILYLAGLLLGGHNEELGNFIAYLCTGILVAVMCFFICKAHPKSIWYTPVVCNAITLLAGIGNYFEGNPNILMPFAVGWVFSVIASVRGRNIGMRRKAIELAKNRPL
ncbi:hypothetical protein [Gramella sp. KN1008]|uniref:hypothetical protein n=1 Tax=Gramella sp. KN1008 TaxID=2529298 RepID=UPI00103C77A6|nr:hypothetical protein [Gramella sp. KN1008]TBW29996.1 hypothetical protein EZJ28_00915 [Gramella sp. KN1008]